MFKTALNFKNKSNTSSKQTTKISEKYIEEIFNKFLNKFDHHGDDALITKEFYTKYVYNHILDADFINNLIDLTLNCRTVYKQLWYNVQNSINRNDLNNIHFTIYNREENYILESFVVILRKTINEEVEKGIRTENGALSYVPELCLSSHLNLFWKLVRNVDDNVILDLFEECWNKESEQIRSRELLFRTMFHLRDFRYNEGKGERNLFRIFIRWLATYSVETRRYWSAILSIIPEYGRWDDIYLPILEKTDDKQMNIKIGKEVYSSGKYNGNITDLEKEAFNYLGTQIAIDMEAMRNNKPVTLAAKWAPSEKSKWNKMGKAYYKLMSVMNVKPKKLRQDVTVLRDYINIVESILTHGEDYLLTKEYMSKMPSQAIRKLKKALERRSPEWENYINSLKNGESNINSSACMPYEWVHEYLSRNYGNIKEENDIIESQWKDYLNNLRKSFNIDVNDKNEKNAPRLLVMADTSGSMFGDRAIEVCLSLACVFSRLSHSSFRDTLITFESEPKFITIPNSERGSLRDTLEYLTDQRLFPWGGSTNIEYAFVELLRWAETFTYPHDHPKYPRRIGLHQDDMPEKILIISDMQFNSCCTGNEGIKHPYLRTINSIYDGWVTCNENTEEVIEETNDERISNLYKRSGYKMPTLIYWNVRANEDVPVRGDEENRVLLSGFSPALFKQVIENINEINPEDIYLKSVMSSRYDKVIDAIKPLMEYESL